MNLKHLILTFRQVACRYAVLGCSWSGIKSNQQEHESVCEYPNRSGADLMTAVVANLDHLKEEMLQQKLLIQMLSCERISICGKCHVVFGLFVIVVAPQFPGSPSGSGYVLDFYYVL